MYENQLNHPDGTTTGVGTDTSNAAVQNGAANQFLKRIGLKIHKDLYDQKKSAEWLSQRVGLARSTIREIIAGRSNPRILTLQAISEGLGYRSVQDFLHQI